MPIYKMNPAGKLVPFERTPFPDLEKVLEDWIEANPHLLLEDEDIAIFARQPRTRFDKYLDLLGLDVTGALVIIELKRGETPRDVLAQALEYAAWVDDLSVADLDELAQAYARRKGLENGSLADIYNATFGDSLGDTPETSSTDRVTFNNRQRIVVVAERFSGEVEQTLRYMRTRLGADVYGVEFSVHRAGDEVIVSTTTVIGRESVGKATPTWTPKERESDDSIRGRVKTEFLRGAVTSVEEWISELGTADLSVEHSTQSAHYIRFLGQNWCYYYYAANWIYVQLYEPNEDEVAEVAERISKPEEAKRTGKHFRFHVASESDLQVVKEIIEGRLASTQSDAEQRKRDAGT